MFSTHVALVPHRERLVPHEELLYVASALQTQVTRDLAPVWDQSGIVSPFLALNDVPPACVPIVIVDRLPKPWHGFHIVSGGKPLALIEYRKGWSLLASHELMEMLCDPWGNRSLPGRSLKPDQGQVEYLVEVCDPCQSEHYTVGGVHVSDFVTPDYYGPENAAHCRYSFTGALEHPLEVAAGGGLTWRTTSGQIWRKPGTGAPQQLSGAAFSRAWLNAYAAHRRNDITAKISQRRSPKGYYTLKQAAGERGALKTSIDQLLERLRATPSSSQVEALVKLLEEFSDESSSVRKEYEQDPVGTLQRYGIKPPAELEKLAPAPDYQRILAALKGGFGFGDPDLWNWLSTHGVLSHAGIE